MAAKTNKTDLVRALQAVAPELSSATAARLLDGLFRELSHVLQTGQPVKVPHIGTLRFSPPRSVYAAGKPKLHFTSLSDAFRPGARPSQSVVSPVPAAVPVIRKGTASVPVAEENEMLALSQRLALELKADGAEDLSAAETSERYLSPLRNHTGYGPERLKSRPDAAAAFELPPSEEGEDTR